MPNGRVPGPAPIEAARALRNILGGGRARPRRLPRVVEGVVDPIFGPLVLGRPPRGAEVTVNILGSTEWLVKPDPLTTWRAIFRTEFRDAPAGARTGPEEVDGVLEQRAVEAVLEESRVFWSSDDPAARFIRRLDLLRRRETLRGEAIEAERQRLHLMTIFTMNTRDYGAGSGGPGSAKVFWGPYSVPDRAARLGDLYSKSEGVDPMYVLAHEIHHAYGYGSEFDLASDVVGIAAHLRSGLQHNPTAATDPLSNWGLAVAWKRPGERFRAGPAAAIRYLHRRYPGELERLALEFPRFGTTPLYERAEWQNVLEKAQAPTRP